MSDVHRTSFKPLPAKAALETPRSGALSGTSDSDAPSGDESSTWILSLSKPYQCTCRPPDGDYLHAAPETADCRAYVDVVLDGILALFALYAPSAIGQGPLFEPYLQLLLFVSLLFGSLLISTTNLAGPLRYAYHNYKSLVEKAHPLISLATAKVTAWAPLPFLVLALLPWFRTWFFMGVIPLTWQFVREEHRRAVSDVSNSVDEYCSKAEVVANKALSDATVAERYEHYALESAAVAGKEALLEQNLRVTDFYDESSVAWAALDRFQSSAEDAAAAASVTLRELDDTNALAESRGKKKFDPIYAKFLDVTGRAKDLTLAAKVAKDRAESFKNAAIQAQTARGALATRARTVAIVADNVTGDVVTAFDAAQNALKLSGEVRHLAARAKTAAEEGRMTDAEDLVRHAKGKLKTAEEESSKAATARKDARTHAREVYTT